MNQEYLDMQKSIIIGIALEDGVDIDGETAAQVLSQLKEQNRGTRLRELQQRDIAADSRLQD